MEISLQNVLFTFYVDRIPYTLEVDIESMKYTIGTDATSIFRDNISPMMVITPERAKQLLISYLSAH